MDKVRFGNTGLQVSKVAMGGIPITRLRTQEAIELVKRVLDRGINFIDTAIRYGDSEEKIGKALKARKREDVVVASKSPALDETTFLKHVDLSLRRLGTEYIDIYYLHAVDSQEAMNQVMAPGGAYEGLRKAIEQGKIRHAGFSSHRMRVAKNLILTEKFEVIQILLNFLDIEAEKEIIPLARKRNIGFVAMKPLGGGVLGDANLAFRYLAQFPNIIPDPGIEKIEEMEEIVQIVDNPRPLTVQEEEKIQSVREELGKEFCHRCNYCQPCPQEIPISTVLSLQSMTKRNSFRTIVEWVGAAMEKAMECTDCGTCVQRCPYNLPIPELLKRNLAFWEEYKRKVNETIQEEP